MKDAGAQPDLELVRQRKPKKDKPQPRSRAEIVSWDGVDKDLFEALRALRLRLARDRGVPPYVVFHDTTLRELARQKPTTRRGAAPHLRHGREEGRRLRRCGDRNNQGHRGE